MTLLKRFTVWATASNRTPNTIFQSLRLRLLLSYLTVMAAILGTFGAAVYIFFTRSLDEQLNHRLLILAHAAVLSLEALENEGIQSLNQNTQAHEFKRNQSLEWFNAEGKLLASKGTIFSTLPLNQAGHAIQQQDQIRTLTIAVNANRRDQKTLQLKGYIRASESTNEVEVELRRLGWGLALGGIMALVLCGIGGMWLTQQALEPVEQNFQRLKQFTADASHELRNPLTVIQTAVDVMLSHPERIHPLDTKKLAAINSATNQMTRLVEDLLFLARTDAVVSIPSSEWVPIPLNEVLQDLVALLEPQAQAKGITLKSHLLVGISVNGDAAQVSRLFSNLLENALKYTPAGGNVVLAMTRVNQDVIVSVKDTGIGIAPEDLQFVFQRFWRADKARSSRSGGLGLGLAIAQAIAQRYQGEITVKSKIGIGSCFQVRLPIPMTDAT